ncbi:MAG: hypothetical protein ABJB78_05130, partial [Betaproteobacteria bacterium]
SPRSLTVGPRREVPMPRRLRRRYGTTPKASIQARPPSVTTRSVCRLCPRAGQPQRKREQDDDA